MKYNGFLYGFLATVAMSAIMLIGVSTGAAPMPQPIPTALVELVFSGVSQVALVVLGSVAHLAYGAVAGGLYTYLVSERDVWRGLGVGTALWLVMQLVVLPLLGWGVFGTAETPKIAVATLVLHLIYGGVLGWGTSTS